MISPSEEQVRKQALKQLRRKHEFHAHLISFLVVNLILVALWATGGGFFWPIFPILGWGIGLIFHGWDTYERPPTEAKIRREMERLRSRTPTHA